MPRGYSQKAVFLRDVEPRDAIFTVPPRERSDTDDDSDTDTIATTDVVVPVSVALSQIRHGLVGYIGDVNNEEGSQQVFRAMLDCAQFHRMQAG